VEKTARGFKIRARVAGNRLYLVRLKVKLRGHDDGLL
jgi:uncharacterized Zn finger protein